MPLKTNFLDLDIYGKPIVTLKPVVVLTKEVTKLIFTIGKNTQWQNNMYTLKYLINKIVLKH